jgi:hypothetical protein
VRQAILIVVLVAASFLGGVFVNGPGLHWAQTRLLRSLGLSDGGEIASVDLKATGSTETISDGPGQAKPAIDTTQSSLDPVPSVVAEDQSSVHHASDRRSMSMLQPNSKDGRARSPSSQPSVSRAAAKAAAGVSTPLNPQVTPARAASPPSSAHDSALSDPEVTPAILDSLAALLPSTRPASGSLSPSSSHSELTPKLVGDGGDEWVVLERKMQTLGVSRYVIEAEPGGRVVFSCLIPLAGRQAIAQRFEAEGDDIVQATHAALRRIGLWRATQAPSK